MSIAPSGRSLAIHLLLAVLSIHVACGKGAALPEDAIEKADIIAHIRVKENSTIFPVPGSRLPSSDSPAAELFPEPEKYRKVATVSCLQLFKGTAGPEGIAIEHTNGFSCPNVIYQKGKEYIVFLKKGSGKTYETMSYYMGQFLIEDGKVARFYLMPECKRQPDLKMPYERIAAFLKEEVATHQERKHNPQRRREN